MAATGGLYDLRMRCEGTYGFMTGIYLLESHPAKTQALQPTTYLFSFLDMQRISHGTVSGVGS